MSLQNDTVARKAVPKGPGCPQDTVWGEVGGCLTNVL